MFMRLDINRSIYVHLKALDVAGSHHKYVSSKKSASRVMEFEATSWSESTTPWSTRAEFEPAKYRMHCMWNISVY